MASQSVQSNDLDRYLADPLVPSSTLDFDILMWWKVNEGTCPALASMARDFLAVPATTVTSELVSVF